MTARSRLEAWWEDAVMDRRDRCVDAAADWWTRAVLERRDGFQDRVAEWWERAVLERRDRLSDRVSAWPREVSLPVALAVVLAAGGAGSLVAISGPWKPDGVSPAASAHARTEAAARDERLAMRLSAIVERLRVERGRARERLASSRTTRRQGTAARVLADAYRSGATKLARAGGRDVRAAMRAAAAAYDALAIAAVQGERRRFSAARLRIARTEKAVTSTLARLAGRAS